jgi:hypothetical protein
LTSQSQANNQREKGKKGRRVVYNLSTYLHFLAYQSQGKEHKGQGKKQHEGFGGMG